MFPDFIVGCGSPMFLLKTIRKITMNYKVVKASQRNEVWELDGLAFHRGDPFQSKHTVVSPGFEIKN